jgi:hypothetical protein
LGVARDRAKAALEEVDKGNNPALRKRATRLALVWGRGAADAEVADIKAEDLTRESPVGDVWKGYLKVHLIPEATRSSVARFRGIFEKRILPKWRARPIAGMVKADALTVIDAALLRGQSAKNSTITVSIERDVVVRGQICPGGVALAEVVQAGLLNGRNMDEHILTATAIRRDETIPLSRVEPLHSTCRHVHSPFEPNGNKPRLVVGGTARIYATAKGRMLSPPFAAQSVLAIQNAATTAAAYLRK